MKKLLAIAFLLIPFFAFSQTTKPIDGFLGIKFGSTREQVIAAMKVKGAVLNAKESDAKSLIFSNVKLGHRSTTVFFVYLVGGKAYSALFVFQPDGEPQTIEYYKSLTKDVSEIYGDGRETKDFKSPYKDGDGDEITALQGGYAKIYTNWSSGKNTVQASIDHKTDKLSVVLYYQDGVLAAQNQNEEKAKEKSDF